MVRAGPMNQIPLLALLLVAVDVLDISLVALLDSLGLPSPSQVWLVPGSLRRTWGRGSRHHSVHKSGNTLGNLAHNAIIIIIRRAFGSGRVRTK